MRKIICDRCGTEITGDKFFMPDQDAVIDVTESYISSTVSSTSLDDVNTSE